MTIWTPNPSSGGEAYYPDIRGNAMWRYLWAVKKLAMQFEPVSGDGGGNYSLNINWMIWESFWKQMEVEIFILSMSIIMAITVVLGFLKFCCTLCCFTGKFLHDIT